MAYGQNAPSCDPLRYIVDLFFVPLIILSRCIAGLKRNKIATVFVLFQSNNALEKGNQQ